AGRPARAAELYARIGARPEEAAARLEAARLAVTGGLTAHAERDLAAALAFYHRVGAHARLAEARGLRAADPARDSRDTSSQ
ncbi:MAG TPA: hypothetical protein VFA46_14640, partial [Actinomycetes bacterium]|nr:hypothetical protein [Actinomycetes bacterium]